MRRWHCIWLNLQLISSLMLFTTATVRHVKMSGLSVHMHKQGALLHTLHACNKSCHRQVWP